MEDEDTKSSGTHTLGENTTANSVIKAMKRQFARHGIPDELITNNGTEFESQKYLRFTQEYGFTIVKSAYYSRVNGKAEYKTRLNRVTTTYQLSVSFQEDSKTSSLQQTTNSPLR